MLDRQTPLLLDRIGTNELVETWLAQWPESSQKLLLKRPSATGGDDLSEANEHLTLVYGRTRDFRHRNILKPKKIYHYDRRVVLVRNYLEHATTLSPELLAESISELLFQIFSAVDFLHSLGLVHTDLSRSNMLVVQRNGSPKLLLTDLDFVTPIASRTTGDITGVPGHIAPEVIRERVLLPQSDFYSLGVMLSKLVQTNGRGAREDELSHGAEVLLEPVPKVDSKSVQESFRALIPLINHLLEPRYQERPAWLGQLVEKYAPRFGWDFEVYKRSLFWSLIETAATRASRDETNRRAGLSEAIAGDIDAMGLNHELFRDISNAWSGDLVQLGRLFRELLRDARIERIGYSWKVRLSDEKTLQVYSDNQLSEGLNESLSADSALSAKLKYAIRFKLKRNYYKSYLIFRHLLETAEPDTLIPSLRAAIQAKLGYVCLALGRSETGREYFQQALQYAGMPPRKTVLLTTELSSLYSQGNDKQEAAKRAWEAVAVARNSGDRRLRLFALNKLLWARFMLRGGKSVHRKTKVLFDYAQKHGYESATKPLANTLAVVLWSSGKLKEATTFLTQFIGSHGFLATEQIQISLYTNLGLLYGDQSQFGKAINAYKRAQSLSMHDTNWGRQGFAHSGLISSYTASSDFQRALEQTELLYEKATRWADPAARTIYNINVGQILLAQGQLTSAFRHLKLAEELARVNDFSFHRAGALLLLTKAHRWHGDYEGLGRDLETLEALMGDSIDWRLRIHVEFSHLWLDAKSSGSLDTEKVELLIKDAAKRGRALEYAEGLFLLAEFGHDKLAFKLRSESDDIWKICRKKRAPRYAGLYYLIRSLSGKADDDARYRIEQLKKATDQLWRAESRYHATVVTLRLIRCYRELGELQRTQNVLNLAKVIAEPLENQWLNAEIEEETELLRALVGSESTNIDLLRDVGNILTSVHNYRQTLELLLRQAVALTGAERGAIVLTHSDEKALKVEVSHACDEVSERDILTISLNSIARTLEQEQGLIVHDAQRNKLTREFRSVKQHNIVSIACVPMTNRGRLLGALYLDHRSIPALFEKQNYELIKPLAQFMAIAIDMTRGLKRSEAERQYAAEKLEALGASVGFLAIDNKSRGVLSQLPKVAAFDTTVLLQGESGTGKGLLAEAIHNQSRRSEGPFIALNCSHIRGANGLAELFGVEKSAFTGVTSREGRIERADGGTLFLDEIAELQQDMQATLLDVLESKRITRTGGTSPINVDFRLICATNANIEDLARRNNFRMDLFFRISAFVINVPPLRERPDDVEPLVRHLIAILPGGGANLAYSKRFIAALKGYNWPGNVRELRNEIERVLILRESNLLDIDLLNPEIAQYEEGAAGALSLDEFLLQAERDQIMAALKRTKGNVTAAGRILKAAPSTLRSKLSKLKIEADDFKLN